MCNQQRVSCNPSRVDQEVDRRDLAHLLHQARKSSNKGSKGRGERKRKDGTIAPDEGLISGWRFLLILLAWFLVVPSTALGHSRKDG